MTSAAPRVSVIIPTRNRLPRLQRAVASVARQTYRDLEVLVIDDGSTDGTPAWLEAEAAAGSVRNIASAAARDVAGATHSSRGAAAARNRGIEQARGELIAFLDDDDVWLPGFLEAQVARLDADPAAALSYTGHLEVRSDGGASRPDPRPVRDYGSPLLRMLAEAYVHTMSVVVCRKRVFERHGLFEESLSIVHDWEWYVRLLAAGERFEHVERELVGRAVPGGLVTRHRAWFVEESELIAAAFAADPASATRARLVRGSRSLFFARLALSRGDIGFGLLRLAAAFSTAPWSALDIAARRVFRQLRRLGAAAGRLEPWDPAMSAARGAEPAVLP